MPPLLHYSTIIACVTPSRLSGLTAGLLAQVPMGRTVDPAVAKTILQYLRGQDLYEAWVQNGSPGSWGNLRPRVRRAAERRACVAGRRPAVAPSVLRCAESVRAWLGRRGTARVGATGMYACDAGPLCRGSELCHSAESAMRGYVLCRALQVMALCGIA
jgi:hypothetical protein